ncbi:MAG: hypothetical protein QOI96_2033, partial [Verrucomicrobiota bacterium]
AAATPMCDWLVTCVIPNGVRDLAPAHCVTQNAQRDRSPYGRSLAPLGMTYQVAAIDLNRPQAGSASRPYLFLFSLLGKIENAKVFR